MKSFKDFCQLKEALATTLSITYGKEEQQVQIWKNPGSSDLVALNKSGLKDGMIRYIGVASEKTVYVWDANATLHHTVISKLTALGLIRRGLDSRCDEISRGIAKLSQGELVFLSDEDWSLPLNKLMKGEQKWERIHPPTLDK